MKTMTNLAAETTDDDLGIARRIVAGYRAAFGLLMRRHNRRLCRMARATLRNDAEAEDALQDAYLHA
jgi:DNA-directed RNA polymerase specialized sigma24 family protein